MNIPRIIHLTWKTKSIPPEWAETLPAWRRHHPGWEVRFHTDEDNERLVRTRHPELLGLYLSFPHGIQRADFVRYLYLLDFGGVYSDMDIVPTRPIDPYLRGVLADAILVKSGNVDVFTNSFMASPPNSPFWRRVIEDIISHPLPWYAVGKHLGVMHSTGPLMLDRVARGYLRPLVLLPREVFMGYSVADHGVVKPRAALRPLPGGSWNEWDSILLNRAMKLASNPLLLILVFTALLTGVILIRRARKS